MRGIINQADVNVTKFNTTISIFMEGQLLSPGDHVRKKVVLMLSEDIEDFKEALLNCETKKDLDSVLKRYF